MGERSLVRGRWYTIWFLLLASLGWTVAEEPLTPEVRARSSIALGNAAVYCKDYKVALRHYQEGLDSWPGVIAPEPVFRVQLLVEDFDGARRTIDRALGPTAGLLTAVLEMKVAGKEPPAELLEIQAASPQAMLYKGLLLHHLGRKAEAREHFLGFLSQDQWGRELVVPLLLESEKEPCRMCRTAPTADYSGPFPVCAECSARLSDPDWWARIMHDPDEESIRLMENLSGQKYDLHETLAAIAPDGFKEPAPTIPVRTLDELLQELAPDTQALWERAEEITRERDRPAVGAGELGMALFEGEFDPMLVGSAEEQESAYAEFQDMAAETDEAGEPLTWALNQANWFHRFSLHQNPEGIDRYALLAGLNLQRRTPSTITVRHSATLAARKMSDEQHDLFQRLSVEHPQNLFLHLMLMFRRDSKYGDEARSLRKGHLIWMMRHHPQLMEESDTSPPSAPELYRELTEEWIRLLPGYYGDPVRLAPAARHFCINEPRLSLALYARCQELEPDNHEWSDWFSRTIGLMSGGAETEEEYEVLVQEQFELLEQSLDRAPVPSFVMTELVVVAYDAGQPARARELAQQLVDEASQETNWNTGNALHKAHLVLGLLALDDGDLGKAKSHILDSGRIPGSPQLNSFGPNMRLALALLQRGESQVVLEYFELCGKFWPSPMLDEWRDQVRAGEIPDFAASLSY